MQNLLIRYLLHQIFGSAVHCDVWSTIATAGHHYTKLPPPHLVEAGEGQGWQALIYLQGALPLYQCLSLLSPRSFPLFTKGFPLVTKVIPFGHQSLSFGNQGPRFHSSIYILLK